MERAGSGSLTAVTKIRRWKYLGHILKMNETKISPQSWKWTPSGERKRKRGRPNTTLRRTIPDDMMRWDVTDFVLDEKAQDGNRWQALLSALCT